MVLRPGVGVHVLVVVEEHDGPECEKLRECDGNEEHPSSQAHTMQADRSAEEHDVATDPDDILANNTPIQPWITRASLPNEGFDRPCLVVGGYEKICGCDEQVVTVREAPGDGRVAVSVDVAMVV